MRIAGQLEQWEIGADDLAVCGGASGTDILFAEECARRGAHLRLLLAQEVEDFVRDSVQPAGSGWARRFHALREKAEVAIQPTVSARRQTMFPFTLVPTLDGQHCPG